MVLSKLLRFTVGSRKTGHVPRIATGQPYYVGRGDEPDTMAMKFPTYTAIEKWAKNNPVMVSLMVVLVVCSSVVTLIGNGYAIYERGHSLLFPNSIEYKKLMRLSTDTTIEYFTSILGAPQFRNTQGKMREYIYVHPKYYVQAVANTDDVVQIFAVTTRNRSFSPVFDLNVLTGSEFQFVVELGKTTFADLKESPTHVYSNFGARRQWYHESYYFGNPGNYLTYVVAHADAGGIMPDDAEQVNNVNVAIRTQEEWNRLDKRVQLFRHRYPINTFGIASMGYEVDADSEEYIEIGADYDTVRVLDRTGM